MSAKSGKPSKLEENDLSALGSWPAYAAREAVLRDLERAIAATPEALDTRFYYASFLRDHGRFADALAVFEEILARAPAHTETLVAYGVLLAYDGRRLDARAAFERAVASDPAHRGALVNLANQLTLDEPARARELYAAALALDPACAPAHRGLCSLATAEGDMDAAARHRAAGYAAGPFGRRPYFGAAMPVAVLALVSTDGGNIPLAALLDERTYLVQEVYVEAYRGEPLPQHAFVVNAIADVDRAPFALERAAEIARAARRPVVNAPERVAASGRVANAARFAQLEGVVAPAARVVRRDAPHAPALPAILRVPGRHMGRAAVRVDDAAAFAAALATLPGRADPIAIDYVETRSPDGAWRKYRVMTIDGALYPLHLAIAHRWDVHYFSAAMGERADYRAEEARFLADPVATIGAPAWAALGRVRDVLGLDYAGVDFAVDPAGRVVVFEANAAMTIIRPENGDRFAYRTAACDAIAAALTRMFRRI